MKNFCEPDLDRFKRQRHPEVIYCPGKTTDQIIEIVKRFISQQKREKQIDSREQTRQQIVSQEQKGKQTRGQIVSSTRKREHLQDMPPPVMCSRTDKKTYLAVKRKFPHAKFYPSAKIIAVPYDKKAFDSRWRLATSTSSVAGMSPTTPFVCVVTAGTTDIPVAEEAAVVCGLLGTRVERIYDVGVAGLHRILKYKEVLTSACCVIVVAGMEGALPSVVGGLVPCPVLGVPTSVGYGANFFGLSALLTMLNSCAANVCAVNIDDGLGAGVIAHLIAAGQRYHLKNYRSNLKQR